ncbi:tetrapyrrole methylase family protein [Streptococcus infantis SK970]|nr:tetrapyrrole methylase family protein [Streptococcus infantis SK970]
MLEVYGDRSVVLVRELTKIFEEYQRGSITELLENISQTPLKGECLLIVEGASLELEDKDEEDLFSEIQNRIQQGVKKIKLLRKSQNSTSGIKASSTQLIMNGKRINRMTKQGSLPSSLFCYTSKRKIRKICGCQTVQWLVFIWT